MGDETEREADEQAMAESPDNATSESLAATDEEEESAGDGWIHPTPVDRLTGDESFEGFDARVRDFWAFAMSDLRMNNVRGYLAEFLVAKAVGANGSRVEWDAYDVLTPEGIRVEVKSAGYLQVWAQRRLSRISFGSMKGRTWTPEDGESPEATLNADVYVFAIQAATRHDDYDALDVGQWKFYVVARTAIEATGYASIGLPTLRSLTDGAVDYAHLGAAIRTAAGKSGEVEA